MFDSTLQFQTHSLRAGVDFGSARTSKLDSRSLDRLLLADEEPELGAHIVSHRRRYSHHGIYVGAQRVVHYAGLAHGMSSGPVEEVSLREFAHDRPIWLRRASRPAFPPQEVVRRARMRVGENRYQVLRNNCEHFCEWCLHGESRSFQVECLSVFGRMLVVLVSALAMLRRPAARLDLREESLSREPFEGERAPGGAWLTTFVRIQLRRRTDVRESPAACVQVIGGT